MVSPRANQPSPIDGIAAGVKIALQISPEPTEDDLRFAEALGIDHVVLWTNAEKASAEYYRSRKELFARHGIEVYGFGNASVHNQPDITLNTPNRDAKVEEYLRHLRALGAAGIPYTTYAHMANGIWSTERELNRGASARAFNADKATVGHWHGTEYALPLTNEREYSEDEIWENFTYFIRKAARVAEEENVMIGIHPDDQPMSLGGVPRIFSTFENYKRALEIADSPNVGICLCVGCWLEGGDLWGADAITAIRHFAERDQLFKIHFRNVDKPLPHFVETFLDNGYGDMYAIMRTLHEVGFRGVAIPDHIPTILNEPRLGTAFSIGYMKALLNAAKSEAAH
jgi:mannonate dehydratase